MSQVLVVDTTTTPVRLTVNAGESFVLTFPVYNTDSPPVLQSAAGFTAHAVVKRYGTGELLASWSTGAGSISCGPAGVALTFDATLTAAWTWESGQFELDIAAGGNPARLAEGPIVVRPQLVTLPIT